MEVTNGRWITVVHRDKAWTVWREHDSSLRCADLLVAGNIPQAVRDLQTETGGFDVVCVEGRLCALLHNQIRPITHDESQAAFRSPGGCEVVVKVRRAA